MRNDIDYQPVKQEAEIGERGVHVLAQEAICAVGTDDVTTAHREMVFGRQQFARRGDNLLPDLQLGGVLLKPALAAK